MPTTASTATVADGGSSLSSSMLPAEDEYVPLEIPNHGPAEMYPEDPELEVVYIMSRYKAMLGKVSYEEPEDKGGTREDPARYSTSREPTTDYFKVHSEVLWHDIMKAESPLERMKGRRRK
eukprot:3384232-Pyramimonas_sp.AAC.3